MKVRFQLNRRVPNYYGGAWDELAHPIEIPCVEIDKNDTNDYFRWLMDSYYDACKYLRGRSKPTALSLCVEDMARFKAYVYEHKQAARGELKDYKIMGCPIFCGAVTQWMVPPEDWNTLYCARMDSDN